MIQKMCPQKKFASGSFQFSTMFFSQVVLTASCFFPPSYLVFICLRTWTEAMETSMDSRRSLVGMTGTATLTFDGPRWTEICGSATQLLSSFEHTWKMSMTSLRSALLLRAQRPILVLQMPSLAIIILAFKWSWRVLDYSSDWDAHSDKVNTRRCSWLSCPISHPGATQIPAVMFLWRLSRCLISTSLFH